jgi:hypothetical protein
MIKKFIFLINIAFLISCSESPRFELLNSKETGIDFNNTIVETDSLNIISYENIYNGAGVGIGDLNNDGLQDIIFAGNQVITRIYLNLGDFMFKDITSNFEGLSNNQWYTGVTVADVNNDSWPDIYLTSTAGKNPLKRKNKLWINNGIKNGNDPTFTEHAEQYGIADTSQSVAAAFFDYDLDGYLDLYVLNNTVSSRMNTSYRPKTTDGSSDSNDRLYHNNGNGTFTDVTVQAGIVDEGFGLGLAIADVNKDGYPDIYISNDYIANDVLYINQGNRTFRNDIKKYLSYQSTSSMGNDIADVNNDGNPDIITLDMMPGNYDIKKQTINGFSYIYYTLDEQYNYEHQYLRNMLHIHNGFIAGEMLPYSEIGQMTGIYQTDWSWSSLFADYDNDGDKDLIITTGYPKDLRDRDFNQYRQKVKGYMTGNQELLNLMPTVKIPNVTFENLGLLQFKNRTDWMPSIPSYSSGASFVDLDNDGDLDFVINNTNDKAFIFRNKTIENSKKSSNYLKMRLKGRIGNSYAFGAKVEIWNQNNYQYTENNLIRGYASSVDPVIHFGLAGNTTVDSIKVTWPATGNKTIMKNVNSNQILELDEVNSIPSGSLLKPFGAKHLLFRLCDNVISYTHEQTDFNDYFLNQKLLPHKFSQMGPVMAKGDINNDGREDLIIGSSNTQATKVFLRTSKGFKESNIEGLTTQKEYSESDIAVLDIDKDGDQDIVVAAGGYESKKESEKQQDLLMAVAGGFDIQDESLFKHYVYENSNGSFVKSELPVPGFLASVVRPRDFNHDGYPDLFIGSRVKKNKFPYANLSHILINNKGKFSANSVFKFGMGMVTDAIWTDYDKDGWEDLLIAGEWNSLTLLKNVNGKELVPQNIPELESHRGIWYSLASGDFDNDGDDDYIVGNLGNNHRFTINATYPLNLYAVDLDLEGIISPLMTGYWKDRKGKMKEYPVNYLDELKEQSSYFQLKFKDYTSFSYTGIDEILDEKVKKRVKFRLSVNTTSSYIIWNDNGKFSWEELPEALQMAPINKMIVQDFNGDNYPDVLLGGNDYTYDVSTGNYDALKGIVLLNKGKKHETGNSSFELLIPSQSGILLQGMLESLLYFKGDTSLVVAGFNRGKALVFELRRSPMSNFNKVHKMI